MTAMLDIVNAQETYVKLVDKPWPLRKVDAVVVLRHHDRWQNLARLEHGCKVLTAGFGRYLLQVNENHTAAEASRVFWNHVPIENGIILVTHQWHMYRAFLTFLKVFGKYKLIIPSPIYGSIKPGDMGEWEKIDEYQKKGDVAEYGKGAEYLEWLSSSIVG